MDRNKFTPANTVAWVLSLVIGCSGLIILSPFLASRIGLDSSLSDLVNDSTAGRLGLFLIALDAIWLSVTSLWYSAADPKVRKGFPGIYAEANAISFGLAPAYVRAVAA